MKINLENKAEFLIKVIAIISSGLGGADYFQAWVNLNADVYLPYLSIMPFVIGTLWFIVALFLLITEGKLRAKNES